MKSCNFCGNEIEDNVRYCKYCDSIVPLTTNPKIAQFVTINLEAGMPTTLVAIQRMEEKIRSAKNDGIKLIKIIHGYGSSGIGGKIKVEVRNLLPNLQNTRKIRFYLAGEDYSDATRQGQKLLANFPELRKELTNDRRNAGITFVEI